MRNISGLNCDLIEYLQKYSYGDASNLPQIKFKWPNGWDFVRF